MLDGYRDVWGSRGALWQPVGLRRAGCLVDGEPLHLAWQSDTSHWKFSSSTQSIGQAKIHYALGTRTGQRKVMTNQTSVTPTSTNFGGRRWWFRCPSARKHEFYFASCRFELSQDGQSFRCEFTQQADPHSKELAKGQAKGELRSGATFEPHAARVRDMKERYAHAAELATKGRRCIVLRDHQAQEGILAQHQGATYHFCCPACRDVFLSHPGLFLP